MALDRKGCSGARNGELAAPLLLRMSGTADISGTRCNSRRGVWQLPPIQDFAMPILNIKLSAPPSAHTSSRVAAALTDLTVEVLKKKRELTAVAIDYVAPTEWFIAGASAEAQPLSTFHLDIKVTEGTNTKDEKALYVSRAFAAIEHIIGPVAQASYIVVHDVRGDSWGYQGQTQEYRYVRGQVL